MRKGSFQYLNFTILSILILGIADNVTKAQEFKAVGPSEPVKIGARETAVEVFFDLVPMSLRFTLPSFPSMVTENGIVYSNFWAETYEPRIGGGSFEPPFELKDGEDLILRIFIDKNLVEVFANDRQAAAFAHEHIRENPNITLFTKDKDLYVKEIKAWKMNSIYEGDTVFQVQ